jgi:protocatechuate 3,4-dioxygenase beta subunit
MNRSRDLCRVALAITAAAVAALLAASAPAAASNSACPTSNYPNELVLAGGSGQTTQLGKPFAVNLSVALANTNGCPVTGNLAGVNVTFDAPGSGASGVYAGSGTHIVVVGTDSQGVATAPTFTANFTVGDYTVDAQSDYGTVELYLSNTANGLASAITPTGGDNQSASLNSTYSQPLEVRVTDAAGNPVQGATVTFSVVPGVTGASASFLGGGQATASTDSNGTATSPPLLANGSPGKFMAMASTGGVSTVAMFSLDNHAAANTITATGLSAAKATVDLRYSHPLQARVLDASGQPVEGAQVTFTLTAADNGATASFLGAGNTVTELTDMQGVASSPALTANKTAGSFMATAITAGQAAPASYRLTNKAGAPYALIAGAADGATTEIGTRFPVRFAVTVADKDGNPVSGAVISFTAPSRGASGHFTTTVHRKRSQASSLKRSTKPMRRASRIARVRTDAEGIAIAPPFTANRVTGGYIVRATANGSSKRAAFALVNVRG